jgi:hypothetical protein
MTAAAPTTWPLAPTPSTEPAVALPHESLEARLGAALYAESRRPPGPSAAAERSRARLARRQVRMDAAREAL